MATPKLNGKHGELITKMYAKIGVLGNDIANIKDSQKDLKKEVSKIHESITDLKISATGASEKIKAVSDDLDEHKKDHNRSFGKTIAILGVVATFISILVSLLIGYIR